MVTSFTENKAENKKESIADSTRTLAGDCELLSFDEIWGHYPKKTGRSKAQRAYDLAISKGANAFAILAETVLFSQYTQSMLDRDEIEWRYIPSGGVWYEEERWRDETLLIGRHLGFDKGMEHNRQAAELRRLATAALEREMQPEILERMRAIILDMPY